MLKNPLVKGLQTTPPEKNRRKRDLPYGKKKGSQVERSDEINWKGRKNISNKLIQNMKIAV